MNLKTYLLILNIINFFLYGWDKFQATRKKERIPEKTLLGLAILGGGFGGFLGQFSFRHKTKKPKFYLVNILSILAWAYLLVRVHPEMIEKLKSILNN